MAPDVFLSYRNEDKAAADRLCAALEGRNVNCWIAPRNIPPGAEWPSAIVDAIGQCRVFVLVLSSNSKNARQISREAELADKHGCKIITFRIEDVEPPPGLNYFLGNVQWVDAFGDQFEAALAQIAQVIAKAPERGPDALPGPIPGPALAQKEVRPGKSLPWIGLAAVLAIAVIGAGVWMGLHRSPSVPAGSSATVQVPVSAPAPATPADSSAAEMSQAKTAADRFLNERETGKLDAAWGDLAATFQNNVDKSKWLASQAELQRHGPVTNQFNGCTPAGNGFSCDYTLRHGDGTAERDDIRLIRDPEGAWRIARSEMRKLPKS